MNTFGQRAKRKATPGRIAEYPTLPSPDEMKAFFYKITGFGRFGKPEELDGHAFPSWMKSHPIGRLVIDGSIGVPTCFVTGAILPFHPDGLEKQDWNPAVTQVSGFHYKADGVVVAAALKDFTNATPVYVFDEARKAVEEAGLLGMRSRQTLDIAKRVLKSGGIPKVSGVFSDDHPVHREMNLLQKAFPSAS